MAENKERALSLRPFFAPFFNFPSWLEEGQESGLTISEDDKNVYVEASLPGLKPEEIEVTFERGVLWIRGEKKEEEKRKKYYRKASSTFSYRVHVPGAIDEQKEPDATYKDGIMKVSFSKTNGAKARKIKIK